MPFPWLIGIGAAIVAGAVIKAVTEDDHPSSSSSSSSGSYETHESESQRISNRCHENYEEAQQVNNLVYKSLSALEQVTGSDFGSRKITTSYFDLDSHSSSQIEIFDGFLSNQSEELKERAGKVIHSMKEYVNGKKSGLGRSQLGELQGSINSAMRNYLSCANALFGYF